MRAALSYSPPQAEVEIGIPALWPLEGQVAVLALQAPSASADLAPVLEAFTQAGPGAPVCQAQETRGLLGLLDAVEEAVVAHQQRV